MNTQPHPSTGLVRGMKRLIRGVTLAVLIATAPTLIGGCFGTFPLTAAVYEFNNGVSPGIVRQLVFWAFTIIPVYGITLFVDIVILNLLQFWLPGTSTQRDLDSAQLPGVNSILTQSADGKEADLVISRDGVPALRLTFVKTSDKECEVRRDDGTLLGLARFTESGKLELCDRHGRVIQTVDAHILKPPQTR